MLGSCRALGLLQQHNQQHAKQVSLLWLIHSAKETDVQGGCTQISTLVISVDSLRRGLATGYLT